MTLLSALRNKFAPPVTESVNVDAISGNTTPTAENYANEHGDSKTPKDPHVAEGSDHGSSGSDQMPSEDVQDGVRQVEALTLVWTKTSLGAAYIL